MRTRILIAVFALAAAGCASGAATTTTSESTTAPTTAPAVESAVFTYSYSPGDSYSYDIGLDQHVTMTVDVAGDPGVFGSTEDTPGDIDVHTSVAGTLNYDLSEGPQPDTTSLHISGVFNDINVEGTVDGQPATSSDLEAGTIPDLVEVPDTTIVLDQYGRPISVDGNEVPTDSQFFGDPFALLGGLTSGGLDQPFGPQFPDHPLSVGDSWTEEESQDIPDSDQTVDSSITYTVTGTDTIDGHDVVVIDFDANATGADIDLGAMFQALIEGFASMSDSSTTTDVPNFEFTISIGESSGTGTFWFDQEAGLVRRVEQSFTIPMAMHIAMDSAEGSGSSDIQMSVESAVTGELNQGTTSS